MATKTMREMKDMARRFERYNATAERQRKLQAEREERERKRQKEEEIREKRQKEEEKALWIQAIDFSGFSEAYSGNFQLLAGILIVGMNQIQTYGKSGEEMYIEEFNKRMASLSGSEDGEAGADEQPETEKEPVKAAGKATAKKPATPVSVVKTDKKEEADGMDYGGVTEQTDGEDEEDEYIG